MTRRQHVVRTDEQQGTGTPRSLPNCEILCARYPAGAVYLMTTIQFASITVTVPNDYQRCLVEATVNSVRVVP